MRLHFTGAMTRTLRVRPSKVTGFTLLELLLVASITAMAGAGVAFALRDTGQTQLEREAQRLVALLESARAQSRASGLPVYWHATGEGFEFVGLPLASATNSADAQPADMTQGRAPTPWLADGIQVRDDRVVTLGPEPIIERQRIVLVQGGHSIEIATDGLRGFAVETAAADGAAENGQ